MATSRAERWASDTFDWMADQWGAYQHPGADMPIPRGFGPNTKFGVPPGIARPTEMEPIQGPIQGTAHGPYVRGQDPRLANINLYPPGQRTEPFPEDSPMNLPEFWNTSRDWNKYPMTGEIPGEGGMSEMSPQQIAQIQKRQEMLEHFRRVITARRHAAMNP